MSKSQIKILHTSDWHLGNTLYNAKRDDEFASFLKWMHDTIVEHEIDVLLIAGDIFDNVKPSNAITHQYFEFLSGLHGTCCKNIVVTAGNHDSPSFINAPVSLARIANIQTVAYPGEFVSDNEVDVKNEVLVLKDQNGVPILIVGAVPFLNDSTLRQMEIHEDLSEREAKICAAIKAHYDAVAEEAVRQRKKIGRDIPIVAMGHLFAEGGSVGEGEKDLYIGGLGQVSANTFSDAFDYVALGHLHVSQMVGRCEHIRYSGSPLAMGFNEAEQKKQVLIVTFDGRNSTVDSVEVPTFQRMEKVEGNFEDITRSLSKLINENESIYVEVHYSGDSMPDLTQRLHREVLDTEVRILRVFNDNIVTSPIGKIAEGETLAELDPSMVFDRLLERRLVDQTKRPRLKELFLEILKKIETSPEDAERV